jgi:hypothetical protein
MGGYGHPTQFLRKTKMAVVASKLDLARRTAHGFGGSIGTAYAAVSNFLSLPLNDQDMSCLHILLNELAKEGRVMQYALRYDGPSGWFRLTVDWFNPVTNKKARSELRGLKIVEETYPFEVI